MGKRYQIFADYFQFYVWDAGERPNPPEHFDDEDMQRRIKAAPFVVVRQRPARVPAAALPLVDDDGGRAVPARRR